MRCANNSKAYPSYETISNNCNINERTAKKIVKSLSEKNLLSIIRRKHKSKGNNTNIYEINWDYFINPSLPEPNIKDSNDTPIIFEFDYDPEDEYEDLF